jgi:MFS-type transporter involved in bile tolerance (Atg22 family)
MDSDYWLLGVVRVVGCFIVGIVTARLAPEAVFISVIALPVAYLLALGNGAPRPVRIRNRKDRA